MSTSGRATYIQPATGQVFYLVEDRESGQWRIELFVGGPRGVECIGTWPTRDEAEDQPKAMKCQTE